MNNLEKQVNELKRKLTELERQFRFHNHYGYDKSKIIDRDIRIKSNRFLQLGKTYLGNDNLFEGLATETNRRVVATGLDNDLGFGYKTENSQLTLEHQKATALSFFYGLRPPLYSGPRTGTIAITSGGNTITDPKQTFTVNALAGAYISIIGKSTSTLETHLIASNTATQITISTTWGISENVDYVVFVPVYLGAANYPWQRVYLMGDIRFGRGPSAGANVIYIKYGSGSPEGVVTANVGSLFLRTDGGAGTTLYVKESGTGNTGWAGV